MVKKVSRGEVKKKPVTINTSAAVAPTPAAPTPEELAKLADREKAIAAVKEGLGSTEKGVEIIKYFWSQRGIEKSALNIMDGSGLSPQNRVTTDALVKVMQYARSRPWFNSFYRSLPEINGITMKSGSINGARSYTGYTKSNTGAEYTFAIIINNYDGSSSETVRKMWRVLDLLK